MRILKLSKIKFDSYQKDAVELCKKLQMHGAPHSFWVGGAVRDLLLKNHNNGATKPSGDIDIATEASPAKVKRLLNKLGLRFFDIGEKFGTIGAVIRGRKIEITTFRSESGYIDFRHPSKIKFIGLPEQDAKRRDFTINGMFFNPATSEVFDYVDGIKDLRFRRIKFIGRAVDRIKEDPLRSLRAVRFAITLNFKIVPKDLAQIKKQAALINKISGERVKQELDKIMASDNFLEGIKFLDQTGLLTQIFPEVARLKTVKQSKNYHAEGNVFIHTIGVLNNLRGPDRTMRYAGLLHDIGKFNFGKKIIRDGRTHMSFHGHAQNGAAIFSKVAKRLRFTKEESQKIFYLIEHHMDLRPIQEISEETLIRWAKSPYFIDLIHLRIADSLGAVQTDAAGRIVKKEMGDWLRLIKKVHKWQNAKALQKIIDGSDVMRILNIRPGKKVGEILEKILVLQKQGKIKTKQQGITFLKNLKNI